MTRQYRSSRRAALPDHAHGTRRADEGVARDERLDAVSFILPRALAGRRTVDVVITAGREVSNAGRLVIR